MTIALIVAAGRGERLRAGRPKALVELAGRPLLQWSIEALTGVDGVEGIIVALPAGAEPPPGVIAVEGGAVRSDSVRRALRAAGSGDPADAVIVHDAARPLVTAELANRVLAVLMSDQGLDAAIAATPLSDTVKRVQAASLQPPGGETERAAQGAGVVIETLERSGLWAVQTPQIFRRGALERALDVPDEVLAQATDDAWLCERLGGRVAVVAGGSENLKVTTALDLALAELLLSRREAAQAGRRPERSA
jgi:2-C-methyl-D-erythritol 4-phosphate cytidylyltransferase